MALDLGIFLQGSTSSNKVKVTDNDALAQYLKDKITSVDASVTITERNDGGVETLDLAVVGGSDTNLANTNLALDANRTHDLNTYSLTFKNGQTTFKGNGSTDVTASLLVENTNGIDAFKVLDDQTIQFNTTRKIGLLNVESKGNSTLTSWLSVYNSDNNPIIDWYDAGLFSFTGRGVGSWVFENRVSNANLVIEALGASSNSQLFFMNNGTVNWAIRSYKQGNDSLRFESYYTNNVVMELDINDNVIMGQLPTSSVGLPTGALWNNSGVVNVV